MSRTSARSLAFIVAAALPALTGSGAQARQALAPSTGSGPVAATAADLRPVQLVILAVTVNEQRGDLGTIFLLDDNGVLFATTAFLNEWNLRAGPAPPLSIDGIDYVALQSIPGLRYVWNRSQSALTITAPADAFTGDNINVGSEKATRVANYIPGGFLNYDFSFTRSPGVQTTQALLDAGVFQGAGLLTSSFTSGPSGSVRLMTTWQTDRIDALKTLRIGDSSNATGAWGRGVLFGGVQYGTNFAVRPDFISVAMPTISGKARLPSTIDVYVGNALRSRQSVNAGPFSIQNLPVITGSGTVQLVVTDVLGREQLISQTFFASPSLLREGLVDDAFEFGWQRHDYGLRSNQYRDAFATATYRRGLTGTLTGEARFEVQREGTTTGLSAAMALPAISSVVETSLAASHARGLNPGALFNMSFSYLGQRWSFNARMQANNVDFRQLGSDPANLLRHLGTVQASAPLGPGVLSINYLRRQNWGTDPSRVANLTYSQRVASRAFLTLTLLKPLSGETRMTAGLMLTVLFDAKHTGSSSLNGRSGATTLYSEFQRVAPADVGTGYRLAVLNGGPNPRQEVTLSDHQTFASLQADLVRVHSETSTRLGATGSVATLGDGIYFSRRLDRGFAIVQTAPIAGLPVYLENQVVTRTDARGRALVNNLQPYLENRIRIDPLTLPMDVTVEAVELTVVPRDRGGVRVDFAMRRVRNARLIITTTDGQPLPAWTDIAVEGVAKHFVTGMRGEVSVELAGQRTNRVVARLPSGDRCELRFDMPPGDHIDPVIGPLPCSPAH